MLGLAEAFFFGFVAQNDETIVRTLYRNRDSMTSTIRRFGLVFALVVLLAGASSAYADTILNYQITGPSPNGTFNASFTLSGNPTPSGGNSFVFWFSSLPANVNGTRTNLTIVFSSLLGGGVLGTNSFALVGQQLFSWSSSSSTPTMNVGIFNLLGGTGGGWGSYTMTVLPATSVPEPASSLLLGAGLLTVFGVHLLRRFA
jgi:PEP-CTERM motif-containing protein